MSGKIAKKTIQFIYSGLLWLLAENFANAAPLVIEPGFEESSLAPYIQYLRDSSGELSLSQVIERFDQFQRHDQKVLNFYYDPAVFWLKIELDNKMPQDRELILQLFVPWIDRFSLYQASTNWTLRAEIGDRVNYNARKIKTTQPSIDFRLPASAKETLLIRVQSDDAVLLPLQLKSPFKFAKDNRRKEWLNGAFFGLLGVMVFSNLIIYFFSRLKSYLFYTLNVLAWFSMFFTFDGYAFAWLWPESPIWANRAVSFTTCISLFFGTVFTQSFLDSAKLLPRYHKVLVVWSIITLLLALSSLLIPYYLSVRITASLGCLFGPINVLAGALALRAGNHLARYYLVSWIFLAIFSILYVFSLSGLIPSNAFSMFFLHAGIAIEVIMLSLALGARLRFVEKESNSMQISLETAQIIHDSFMLKDINDPRLEIHSWNQPSELLGGDCFACFKDREQDFAYIMIGDVTGHGVATSLLSAVVIGALETTLEHISDHSKGLQDRVETIAQQLNLVVMKFGKQSRSLMTMTIIGLDLEKHQAIYLNAGHIAIFHKSDGITKAITAPGTPLGLRLDPEFGIRRLNFQAGDYFLLYTDGLIDQENHHMSEASHKSLQKIMQEQENGSLVIEEIKSKFHRNLDKKDARLIDDCTALSIEFSAMGQMNQVNSYKRPA
ncbi:MAG: 7TM diverse intracellular signaling domain-containing protein [Oligoflexus sp.]